MAIKRMDCAAPDRSEHAGKAIIKLYSHSLTVAFKAGSGSARPLETSLMQQGVALTGRNRTGPPCSVGRLTAYAPGGRPVTDDDYRRQRAKLHWPIERASSS